MQTEVITINGKQMIAVDTEVTVTIIGNTICVPLGGSWIVANIADQRVTAICEQGDIRALEGLI